MAARRSLRDANGDVHAESIRQHRPPGASPQTRWGSSLSTATTANNNRTCRIDANGQAGNQPKNSNGCTEYQTYDELNRIVQVQDALNGITVTTHDLLGNPTGIRDAMNKTSTMVYDDLGRLLSATDPLG